MTATDDYPSLAEFASRPSGRQVWLIDRRVEARAALAEIERLRAEVEAWRTAAQGAAAQAVRLRELIHALNIRMVQPFMSGGGQFSAHGTLTADQWAIVAAAFEEADRDA